MTIPYAKHYIDEKDIESVVEVLRSSFLTTGTAGPAFEQAMAEYVGAEHAVAVNSGTAALHCATHALDIGPGDEVIVPPITFAATANSVLYQGGIPVFADVEPDTLCISPEQVENKLSRRTKAVIAVDFAGQPCDYDALKDICSRKGVPLVGDACHALGATWRDQPVGSVADISVFSFHPVKHITTGEGGMLTTNDPEVARRARRFRTHGIGADYRQREAQGSWYYEMTELGYNYRITDIQCALGCSQLKKQAGFLRRRKEIARAYDNDFAAMPGIEPLATREGAGHAYHLYVVKVKSEHAGLDRGALFSALRQAGVGVNVHYIPVHLHPYYRKTFGSGPGLCPVAEAAYEEILSLPMFPTLEEEQRAFVVDSIRESLTGVSHIRDL